MIIINNKYKFHGTINELIDQYSVYANCLCDLFLENVPDCVEDLFYADYEEIEYLG